jgi:hypothetical protein
VLVITRQRANRGGDSPGGDAGDLAERASPTQKVGA